MLTAGAVGLLAPIAMMPAAFATTGPAPGGSVGLFCEQSSWQATALANPPVGGTAVCAYQSKPPINGATGLCVVPWSFTNQPFALAAGPLPYCGATTRG